MRASTNFDHRSRNEEITNDDLIIISASKFFIKIRPHTLEDDLNQIIRLFSASPNNSIMDAQYIVNLKYTLNKIQQFFKTMSGMYDLENPEALKYPFQILLNGKRILNSINMKNIEDDLDYVSSILSGNPGASDMEPNEIENLRYTIRQIQKYFQEINPDLQIQESVPFNHKEDLLEKLNDSLDIIEKFFKEKKLEKLMKDFVNNPDASLMDVQNIESLIINLRQHHEIIKKFISVYEQEK